MKELLRIIFAAILMLTLNTVGFAQETSTTISNSLLNPKLENKMYSSPLLSDSIKWRQEVNMNKALNSNRPLPKAIGNYSAAMSGSIMEWRNGTLYGNSEDVSMATLMRMQGAELNAVQRYGNFTFSLTLSANRYNFPANNRLEMGKTISQQNQFGIGGSIQYDFNENVSATVYGHYISNPFYYSMAAFPYISTSSYGGYFTLHNGDTGIDMGGNNYYDPFARRWQTDPIIRPKFKIGKVKMDIDLGPMVKEGMLRLIGRSRNQGPIIMPAR